MSVILSITQFFQFMKEYVLVHDPIIWAGLKNSYPNVTLNQYYGQICIKCINGIQGTKSS